MLQSKFVDWECYTQLLLASANWVVSVSLKLDSEHLQTPDTMSKMKSGTSGLVIKALHSMHYDGQNIKKFIFHSNWK